MKIRIGNILGAIIGWFIGGVIGILLISPLVLFLGFGDTVAISSSIIGNILVAIIGFQMGRLFPF